MSAPKRKTATAAAAPVTPAAPAVTAGTTPLAITINGRQCAAAPGETVLDVARREGVDIPALCHQAGSAAWGGCRLCLVEVAGVDKLQAACTTWVVDGMSVQTETPRVRARRQSYLRMYLSDHNAYCEAPCTHACPTHIDIPGYLAALAAGDAAGAAALVREELPFPGILGRVCPRYCEPVCRRGDVDEPIAICALHRAAADHSEARLARGASSGKRVAVVGAGPAGLSAAWFLVARGHEVTLYDAEAQAGGVLRYGIPEFRLPAKVLDDELQPLWDGGVRFVGDSKMHYQIDPRGLFDAGFDAVVLSTGAKARSGARGLNERRLDAREFLRQQRDGRQARLSGRVVVVGDGTTAVDAARTALRSGAETVTVISRYSSDTMPGRRASPLSSKPPPRDSRPRRAPRSSSPPRTGTARLSRSAAIDCTRTSTPAAPRKTASSSPAMRSAALAPSSTRWPAASGPHWPSTPGCAAKTSPLSRRGWRPTRTYRISSN